MTRCSPLANSSRVAGTAPSTEFSSGTSAASASPERTASMARVTLLVGSRSASRAIASERSAACANVPSGPRNAIVAMARSLGERHHPVEWRLSRSVAPYKAPLSRKGATQRRPDGGRRPSGRDGGPEGSGGLLAEESAALGHGRTDRLLLLRGELVLALAARDRL